MACENNEIGDIVKKCKILLLDIEGTTTSISFVKDKLFPYAEANVKEFLESKWDTESVKEAVAALRKLAIEDEEQKVEGFVAIPAEDAGKEEQIEGLVKSVKWQMSADRKAGPLKQLQGLIWNQGYDNGDIKGHVYDDVAPALSQWNSTEGQKVYIYSSGSVQAQKLLFNKSVAGDLLSHIEGHFDTAVGAKQEAASYAAIVEKIGCKPEEILFLTDIVKEAEAARSSGLQAALVSREGNAPLPADAAASYPVLQSFDQLTVSNKRKPEPQEQEVPAKVPKTDVDANVKTAAEVEVPETAPKPVSETVAPSEPVSTSENITETATVIAEPEKMEVEEVPITEAETVTEKAEDVAKEAEKTAVQVETVIEEVTTPNEAGDAPVCTVKPVIEESIEKTDKNETEKMETETAENVETVQTIVEPKEQAQDKVDEESAPVAEETSPAVVIQEVTNDQEIVGEEIEMLDDLEPVVVEPPAIEMEDLNNVADVLDKECDEILLKVHDVTNLDSIPVKPMLNSIAEEDIEVENGENTNDIVDSILDSEMELGVKPCEDIDINIVQEIPEIKTDAEIISDKVEKNNSEITKNAEEIAETPSDENIVSETAVEDKADTIKECSASETVTEVVKEDVSAATTEVRKEDTECSADVLPKSESIAEVENNESKEPQKMQAEIAENASDSKPEVLNSEVSNSVSEPEDNKMESEESTVVAVESQPETKENEMELADSAAKPEEAKESEQNAAVSVENETKEATGKQIKEAIGEQLDSKMETEDTEAVKNETEIKERNPVQIDNENEKKSEESIVEPEDNKMESEESVPQEDQAKESIVEPEAVAPESKVNENDNETPTPIVPEPETESKESASNDAAMETEATEKLNGNMNGESKVNQNGDASKEEELSARLSVENGGKEKEMNGANGNGDSSEVEKEQGDSKDTEIPDIKVKSVATDEPHTDPIEQPVEA